MEKVKYWGTDWSDQIRGPSYEANRKLEKLFFADLEALYMRIYDADVEVRNFIVDSRNGIPNTVRVNILGEPSVKV